MSLSPVISESDFQPSGIHRGIFPFASVVNLFIIFLLTLDDVHAIQSNGSRDSIKDILAHNNRSTISPLLSSTPCWISVIGEAPIQYGTMASFHKQLLSKVVSLLKPRLNSQGSVTAR